MGAVGDVAVAPDGQHIWAIVRCEATAPDRFGNECLDSNLDSILQFDPNGNVVKALAAACSSGRTASTSTATATCT